MLMPKDMRVVPRGTSCERARIASPFSGGCRGAAAPGKVYRRRLKRQLDERWRAAAAM